MRHKALFLLLCISIYSSFAQTYDFGDAPDGGLFYPTLLASDGARHRENGKTALWLGTSVDYENDALQDNTCNGDDSDKKDDEDGIVFHTPLRENASTKITVQVSGQEGFINAWIDYNENHSWQDRNEHVLINVPVKKGCNTLTIISPLNDPAGTCSPGNKIARFRLSSKPDLLPTGEAPDGEVEDYRIQLVAAISIPITYDFGDAPDPKYPTLIENDGARHRLDTFKIFLGQEIPDPDFTTSAKNPNANIDPQATGDDLDYNDDEDGISFDSELCSGKEAHLSVSVSSACYLFGWIDFNHNGQWSDPEDQIYHNKYLPAAGTYPLAYRVPDSAAEGITYARFRVSSSQDLNYHGPAPDGEVEDYSVHISNPPNIEIKTPKSLSVMKGQNSTLSILVTNHSKSTTATDVTLYISWAKQQLEWLASWPQKGEYKDHKWRVGTLEPKEQAVCQIQFKALGPAGVTAEFKTSSNRTALLTDGSNEENNDSITKINITQPLGDIELALHLVENSQNHQTGKGKLTFELQARVQNSGETVKIGKLQGAIISDSNLPSLITDPEKDIQYTRGLGPEQGYSGMEHFHLNSSEPLYKVLEFSYMHTSLNDPESTILPLVLDETWTMILRVQIHYTLSDQISTFAWTELGNTHLIETPEGSILTSVKGADLDQLLYPVELSLFSADIKGNGIELKWITRSETNNAGFYLYRSTSKEGPYELITDQMIAAAGNSTKSNTYSYFDSNAKAGKSCFYKLADIDLDGRITMHGPVEAHTAQPDRFVLEQNYPNPFNPQTTISFHVYDEGKCNLSIYNINGQLVRTLVSEHLRPGTYKTTWNGRDNSGLLLPSGVYLYRMKMNDRAQTKKLEFLK